MKKKCLANKECPLARAYDAIGDWWSLLIITRVLMSGRGRFCEIQGDLGMARNILTARLKKLVKHDILTKVPASDGSAYHEYVPTDRGKDLFVAILALRQWGERHFFVEEKVKERIIEKVSGKPIPQIVARSTDGRKLTLSEVESEK